MKVRIYVHIYVQDRWFRPPGTKAFIAECDAFRDQNGKRNPFNQAVVLQEKKTNKTGIRIPSVRILHNTHYYFTAVDY